MIQIPVNADERQRRTRLVLRIHTCFDVLIAAIRSTSHGIDKCKRRLSPVAILYATIPLIAVSRATWTTYLD